MVDFKDVKVGDTVVTNGKGPFKQGQHSGVVVRRQANDWQASQGYGGGYVVTEGAEHNEFWTGFVDVVPFVVGTKVEHINPNNWEARGRVGTVVGYPDNGDVAMVEWSEGEWPRSYSAGSLVAHVEPAPKRYRVVRGKSPSGYVSPYIGDEGVLDEVVSSIYPVRLVLDNGTKLALERDEIEEIVPEVEIQVGDRVQVEGYAAPVWNYPAIVETISNFGGHKSISVKMLEGEFKDAVGSFDAKHIKFVSRPEPLADWELALLNSSDEVEPEPVETVTVGDVTLEIGQHVISKFGPDSVYFNKEGKVVGAVSGYFKVQLDEPISFRGNEPIYLLPRETEIVKPEVEKPQPNAVQIVEAFRQSLRVQLESAPVESHPVIQAKLSAVKEARNLLQAAGLGY